jgi:monoamine oxidase
MDADILVIGAGISGLLAAADLSSAGKKVIILEGNTRVGGRISSIYDKGYAEPVQLGAEFIHGDLPLTKSLLKEANVKFDVVEQDFSRFKNDKMKQTEDPFSKWELFMDTLGKLNEDISLSEFLNKNFPGQKNAELRKWAKNYAAGYDAADAADASAKALFKEWQNEEDQYRIHGGYTGLINYLAGVCGKNGCSIILSDAVKTINWKEGLVTTTTIQGKTYKASKVIVTVPVGILQNTVSENSLTFDPEIPEVRKHVNNIGFGPVLKIVIRFTKPLWKVSGQQNSIRFILSDEKIPTWWTNPDGLPILTGWAGGPVSRKFAKKGRKSIMTSAVDALAEIFDRKPQEIRDAIDDFNFCYWGNEPFALGAYSYLKAGFPDVKKQLSIPVGDTIYFAGEAYGESKVSGTVESALVSARNISSLILGHR